MVERHISMRGEVVDFNRLRLNNSEKVALGNANMNAKGDIVGKGGIVLKTQEQIDADWAAAMTEQKNAATAVDLRDAQAMKAAAGVAKTTTTAQVQTPPGLQTKAVDPEDTGFEPKPQSRRKIIESDE